MEPERVSILSENAVLHWKMCDPLPVTICDPQCVLLNGVLYVGGGLDNALYKSSVCSIKWTVCSTPTQYYALTTYQSQLVLVGGVKIATTNQLWTSSTGLNWKASLPPKPTASYWSSAVNAGSPESLIVAGGRNYGYLDIVEVFTNGKWSTVEPLPRKCSNLRSTLHNGEVYFTGGVNQGNDVYYCDVKYLLLSCQQSGCGSRLWGKLPVYSYEQETTSRSLKAPSYLSSSASFGQHLLLMGGFTTSLARGAPRTTVFALHHKMWKRVGNLPISLYSAATIVLPTGDMLVIGGSTGYGFSAAYGPSAQIFKASLTGSDKHYHQILTTHQCIEMWFIKVILLGAPRLGKTTARRRLTGEILDISSSGEEVEQPSTEAVKSHSVVIRRLSSTTAILTQSQWVVPIDLADEARIFLQMFHSSNTVSTKSSRDTKEIPAPFQGRIVAESPVETEPLDANEPTSSPSLSPSFHQQSSSLPTSEAAQLFHGVQGLKYWWEDIEHLFTDAAFVKMEDTGGQPEFMDMQPALTIGPALYLFFCKLTDDLQSHYTVSYRSPSGQSTKPVKSTYTVEEVLLSTLASVSCFKSYSGFSDVGSEDSVSADGKELLASCNKSVAYILGTHKDLVSEQQIVEFDKKLQHSLRCTDFFKDGLVRYSSADRMILPIDNMRGGEYEVKRIQQFLEDSIRHHFKKLSIPVAWLVLSLCLRKRAERTASLQSVLQLAGKLGISEEDSKVALWFLHHYAGVLMYFPNLAELKDTVICDTQVVYDSATNLIVKTFQYGKVSTAASEEFNTKGKFTLQDIREATTKTSGDYIPLEKLVKLLEHLNIIAIIPSSNPQSPRATYFMPCVLQNATREMLDKWWDSSSSPLSPAPLFIRYNCGYVPSGIFSAMIANLAGNKSLLLISEGIMKNRVQFWMYGDFDMITFISQPKYYAVHLTRSEDLAEISTHEACSKVRHLVESTLETVTSHMNYSSGAEYQLSFECPSHPGRDHLCTVQKGVSTPHAMFCLGKPGPLKMQDRQLVWFKECSFHEDEKSGFMSEKRELASTSDFSAYLSSLPPRAHSYLDQLLDWNDIITIAHYMLDWEESLCSELGLTAVDVHDIPRMNSIPELQRREALKRWWNRQRLQATYRNLLQLFVQAGHSPCAKALCEVLRKKCPSTADRPQ